MLFVGDVIVLSGPPSVVWECCQVFPSARGDEPEGECVLDDPCSGVSRTAAGRELNVNEAKIRDIQKKEEEIC